MYPVRPALPLKRLACRGRCSWFVGCHDPLPLPSSVHWLVAGRLGCGVAASSRPRCAAAATPPPKNLTNPYRVPPSPSAALRRGRSATDTCCSTTASTRCGRRTSARRWCATCRRHGERVDGIPLYVNVLVLRKGREVVLCDAGFGLRTNPNIGWLADGLASIGITPDQITHTVLSHGHSDHIGGFVTAGKRPSPTPACMCSRRRSISGAPPSRISRSRTAGTTFPT